VHPILFEVGGRQIHTYGAAQGVALFGAICLNVWIARKEGFPPSRMWDLAILILVSATVGTRLEYVRTHWEKFADHPWKILDLSDGGEVFYGGLIGATLASLAYALVRRMPILPLFDTYAAAIPLGHAVGRLGCLAAGCCYGAPTAVPWAIVYPPGSRAPAGVPLHPTQLYEAGFDVALGATLLAWGKGVAGRRFGTFLVGYSAFRAFNELFRGDAVRGFVVGGLSNAQATSLALGAIGAVILARGGR
jgi:phosphatidylglycerol:prolipoprotein diacylglycerol transferase